MLELYRTTDCPRCDEVEEHLRELVVAHRVIYVDQNGEGSRASWGKPPVLIEGDAVYAAAAIAPFLETFAAELHINRMVQSDACFLDPVDGKTCL